MPVKHCSLCERSMSEGDEHIVWIVKASWLDESIKWNVCRFCAEVVDLCIDNLSELRGLSEKFYGGARTEDESEDEEEVRS